MQLTYGVLETNFDILTHIFLNETCYAITKECDLPLLRIY